MVSIELLTENNFTESLLDSYERRQEVKKVYRKQNNEYVLIEQPFVEDWDLERRRQIAKKIYGDEYITYIALKDKKVVGFIGLIKQLVGERMILDMMQVSAECRGTGIGRKLFEIGKKEALKAGAKELYISACSSEETIAFYMAMGAEITDDPIKQLADDEPFDLQMVCKIV
ncbi:MAG: GNAT family N-acetyltransferase [Oscillospiraceae bacterium]